MAQPQKKDVFSELGVADRDYGIDHEEGGSRFEQEGGFDCEHEEAWWGGWARDAGPGLDVSEAVDTEGAAREEDEPGWAAQADQRATLGGTGVWLIGYSVWLPRKLEQ